MSVIQTLARLPFTCRVRNAKLDARKPRGSTVVTIRIRSGPPWVTTRIIMEPHESWIGFATTPVTGRVRRSVRGDAALYAAASDSDSLDVFRGSRQAVARRPGSGETTNRPRSVSTGGSCCRFLLSAQAGARVQPVGGRGSQG